MRDEFEKFWDEFFILLGKGVVLGVGLAIGVSAVLEWLY